MNCNGLSPYAILQAHPELDICEKTLYNYIEQGVLHEISGLCAMDLRRQVSRRLPKKRQHEYKKREDRRFLIGRTYYEKLLAFGIHKVEPDSLVLKPYLLKATR